MNRKECTSILLALAALLLASCGEDRTYEYVAKTEEAHWIENQMKDIYLYYQDMKEPEMEAYFYPPEEFFPQLLADADKYSYIDVPEEEQTRNNIQAVTYGFDFVLMNDPTGTTTHQVARVLMVIDGDNNGNSPAFMAGLRRGDFITQINGENVSTSNAEQLFNGPGATLTIASPTIDPETGNWTWSNEREITLAAAIAMENSPYYLKKIITPNGTGRKVGYMMYNDFRAGADENDLTDLTYLNQMPDFFHKCRQQGVTDFILDLRYNQGGQVACAQALASMLAPSDKLGQEFAHLTFNDKRQDLNQTLPLLADYADYNLNLDRLFVLTGQYTASASEMMIYCLAPHMEVHVIGTQTVGKNVAMTRIDSPYGFTMYPVTATVYNCLGQSDYAGGIAPDCPIEELAQPVWFELGDQNELLLSTALQWISTGTQPGASTEARRAFTRSVKAGYSSLDSKHIPGAVLPY